MEPSSGSAPPIYLNDAASAWPKAPGVVAAVAEATRALPEHPGRSTGAAARAVEGCREQLAQLLGGVAAERIVLTSSATQALNLALHGVGLAPGDQVVTTVYDHNSVLRPLHHLAARRELQLVVVGLDESLALDEEAFDAAVSGGARVVVANHASNVTGRVNDVPKLFARAKARGAITILDASQSLGHVPVHPVELAADVVAFAGHKGLRGPLGTGGLYVAPHLELDQVLVGGTGVRSERLSHPPEMPLRLEAGTPNVPALAGLLAALEWGVEHRGGHRRTEEARLATLREGLLAIPGVRVVDPASDVARVGIVSFVVDTFSVEEVGLILAESFGIIGRTGLHCAPLAHEALGTSPSGTIRLSVSGETTELEVASAVHAVKTLAR